MQKNNIVSTIKEAVKGFIKSRPVLYLWFTIGRRKYLTWRRGSMREDQYQKAMKQWYFRATGETLDLETPKTFGEKIQWLKLYDSTPAKTELADKYKVRKWVAEKIGDEYLIPLLGKWDNADDIDFDALPEQFVLKANHGSGWNIIVKDKSTLDIKKTRKTLRGWLGATIAFLAFEMHYRDIPPLILAETYIASMDGDICDYKFYCFHGEPKYCLVVTGRNADQRQTVVDMNFDVAPFTIGMYPGVDIASVKPDNYNQMVAIAKTLCEGFRYVRVDLYNIDGKIYFGEMTFTPAGGVGKILPKEYRKILGDLITL